jgi:hypothetical protein
MSAKSLACIFLALVSIGSTSGKFKRFPAVETYQIQPGVLMEPTYSSRGDLCKVVLEKQHYASNVIDVDAEMSREQIDQMFDHLVPINDRGPKTLTGGLEVQSTTSGVGRTTLAEYKNVSLEMAGKTVEGGPQKYVVAIIKWKIRACD